MNKPHGKTCNTTHWEMTVMSHDGYSCHNGLCAMKCKLQKVQVRSLEMRGL